MATVGWMWSKYLSDLTRPAGYFVNYPAIMDNIYERVPHSP